MARSRVSLVLTLLLLLALPSTARATVLRRVDVDEMTRRAALIFYGTVRESFCHRGPDGAGGIRTTTTFDVQHLLKGDAAEVPARGFRLTLPGGALDGLVARIPGQPRFVPGQRVVLFLERTPRGFTVLGFEQGRFTVEEEPDGSPVAVRRLGGSAVVDPATGTLEEGPADDLRLPLPVLFQRVRAVQGAEVTP